MATIRAYTTIEQSCKLAEILPLDSADMHTIVEDVVDEDTGDIISIETTKLGSPSSFDIPCWSLAALLDVASTHCSRLEITLRADKKYNVFAAKGNFVFRSFDDYPDGFDNLVDVYYEMVLKLNELNLL